MRVKTGGKQFMANKQELQSKYESLTGEKPDETLTGEQLVDKIRDLKAGKKAEKGSENKSASQKDEHKGEKQPVDKMELMVSAINDMGTAFNRLSDTLEKSMAQPAKAVETETPPEPQKEEEKYDSKDDDTLDKNYIPKRYRELADDILGTQFGLKITEFDDQMDFQLTVIVPDALSSVSKKDKAKGQMDERSRMISRALGENGVREWLMLVRQNLNRFYKQEGIESPFKSIAE